LSCGMNLSSTMRKLSSVLENMRPTSHPNLPFEALLLALELVTARGLDELNAQSKKLGMPLGRALVLSGIVDEQNLEKLLRLHAIYQGCKIPVQVILDAYKFSTTENLSVEQGLARAGVIAQVVSYSRLGTILVDSKLITKKQLDECQKLAYQTKLPLGKMLTMHGVISDEQLMLALDVQRFMRSRQMTKDEALARLADSHGAGANIERLPPQSSSSLATQPTKVGNFSQHSDDKKSTVTAVNISELLLVSGILSESDAQWAFDASFKKNVSMEEVFINSGLVSESLLNVAVELQEAINIGDLGLEAASETLAYIMEYGMSSEAT